MFKILPELKTLNLYNPVHILSLGFYSGLAPKAPGTFGTIAGLGVYWLLANTLSVNQYIGVVLLLALIGIYLCGATAKALNVHDHSAIVWDEVVGILITLAGFSVSWTNVLAGFVLFRIFDILKPWPISYCDKKIGGGLGIMLDDVLAGLLSWCCLYGLIQFNLL